MNSETVGKIMLGAFYISIFVGAAVIVGYNMGHKMAEFLIGAIVLGFVFIVSAVNLATGYWSFGRK